MFTAAQNGRIVKTCDTAYRMNHAPDDTEARRLVARCALGQQRALAALHALLARRVHAFAMHRLRDEHDAETVVVDTFHEVWRHAARFRGESRVSTWVLGIARHKALNLRRNAQLQTEDIDDHAESLASDDEGAEGQLQRWQEARVVHACMDRLTAVHRECLQLVYFECLPLADVAAVQQVPEGTVKTRLFHARKSMRACVEGQVAVAS